MLSALEDATGEFPQAVQICECLFNARGHVYPSTLDRVSLVARTRDGRYIEGQAVACHSRTALAHVQLRGQGKIQAYRPALDAIRNADLIVLGPEACSSIIPNLLSRVWWMPSVNRGGQPCSSAHWRTCRVRHGVLRRAKMSRRYRARHARVA